MPVLGVTGGIATGKSAFTRLLRQLLLAEVFDADLCAHELLSKNFAVGQAVLAAFGPNVCNDAGEPDRAKLRSLVFGDDVKRCQLEAILHPAIRNRWTARAAAVAREGGWLVVDIPLLFETQAQANFDCILVVACSPETQRRRLAEKRRLSAELAEKIIASQLDLLTKIKQAHHVIWNDSTESCLERQSRLFANWLHASYG
ncbi:MAG: dephospho-CoA kinase [Chthoniobacter sp.]|nr:dephospho-CoA kinase [Chthoniobacter sp.]